MKNYLEDAILLDWGQFTYLEKSQCITEKKSVPPSSLHYQRALKNANGPWKWNFETQKGEVLQCFFNENWGKFQSQSHKDYFRPGVNAIPYDWSSSWYFSSAFFFTDFFLRMILVFCLSSPKTFFILFLHLFFYLFFVSFLKKLLVNLTLTLACITFSSPIFPFSNNPVMQLGWERQWLVQSHPVTFLNRWGI